MTKLLFVQASPPTTESELTEIARACLDALGAENRDLEFDRPDLREAELPVFDGDKAATKLNAIQGLRARLHKAGASAINELRFQPTLLTGGPAGDLKRAEQDAVRLARAHGRIQTIKSEAVS